MEEMNELYAVLASYKTALEGVVERLETVEKEVADRAAAIEDKIAELNSVVYDGLLSPAKEAMARAEADERFGAFNERYGEKFAPYLAGARAVEGDDFNLARSTFDSYNELDEEGRPDEAQYVDAVIEKVAAQLNAIKEKLGAESVEVKAGADGETEIKVDGETVSSDADSDANVVEIEGDTDPAEFEKYQKELEKELPKRQ